MVKLVIVAVISAALAIGSEHLADHIDKGNVQASETITVDDSIPVNLPTRSIQAPALDKSDAN
jgi:hypothetical protein